MKKLYCYGDSNTWGFDSRSLLGEQFPKHLRWTGIIEDCTDYQVIVDGVNGRKIPDRRCSLRFLEHHLAENTEDTGNMENTVPAKNSPAAEPLLLWIMLGTNDLLTQPAEGAALAAAKMSRFLNELFQLPVMKNGHVRVRLISPPALRRGAWVEDNESVLQSLALGDKMKAVAQSFCIDFTDAAKMDLPLLFDGVHLSEEGHAAFACEMLKVLQ